jgi:hypothetical protein
MCFSFNKIFLFIKKKKKPVISLILLILCPKERGKRFDIKNCIDVNIEFMPK